MKTRISVFVLIGILLFNSVIILFFRNGGIFYFYTGVSFVFAIIISIIFAIFFERKDRLLDGLSYSFSLVLFYISMAYSMSFWYTGNSFRYSDFMPSYISHEVFLILIPIILLMILSILIFFIKRTKSYKDNDVYIIHRRLIIINILFTFIYIVITNIYFALYLESGI